MDKTASALVSAGAVLTAATLGARNGPQRPATAVWYALLRKPSYTPPGPAIGAVWGVLEVLLAGTGYRLLQAKPGDARNAAVGAWGATLLGLAGFPYLFFREKKLASSTVASGAMLVTALGTVVAAREVDKPAAAMTVPLTLWVGFATVLSAQLWRRNRWLSRD